MSDLTMVRYLSAVAEHGTRAREALVSEGHHPSVIYAKAEKAARKDYTDYGVVADRGWLTDKGRGFLAGQQGTDEGADR